MDDKKIRLSILKELEEGNKDLTHTDFQIDEDHFESISSFLEKENLVRGIYYYYNPRVDYTSAQLTLKGEQYLSDNSIAMKTYRGLKEFKDWIPFY